MEAGVVCEGNNTGNSPIGANFLSHNGGTLIGVAEEIISRW